MDVAVAESVELLCNTSLTSAIMWSYYNTNTDDGDVHYVYWNGRVDGEWSRLIVKPAGDHCHILGIAGARPKHGGLYECFDEKGARRAGYRLIVVGMRSPVIVWNLLLKTLLGRDGDSASRLMKVFTLERVLCWRNSIVCARIV